MQAFRDMIHGWVGKVLLFIIIGIFGVWIFETYQSPFSARPVAASVNGEDILVAELDAKVRERQNAIIAGMGANADPARIDSVILRQSVLKELVDKRLVAQYADKAGFLVSEQTVSRLIADEPAFQEKGVFSQKQYERVLRNNGQDPATFPRMLREQIRQAYLVAGIGQTAFTTNTEADRLSALDNEKRDVHIATVSSAAFMGKVQVSDGEVAAYYKAHPAAYTTEDRVQLEYVALGVDKFLDKVQISDADIEARYAEKSRAMAGDEQRHAQHILITVDDKVKDADALARIQQIRKRLDAGEDFAKVAKETSQDPGSASNGGDLGFAGKGMFAPEFEKAMYALKVGEVSAPVKTQFGYHLIKLLEIKRPDVPPMTAMRAQLETEVRQGKAEDLYNDAIEKLDSMAYESSDLKDASQQYAVPIELTGLFTNKGGEGVAASKKVVQAAFSDDLLKDGKNSQGIRLDDGRTVWVRVKTHEAPRLQPLAEVTPAIRIALQLDKAAVLAKADADALAKDLAAGKSPAEAAAAHGVQWMDFPAAARRGNAPSPALLKTAFRLQSPVKPGQWSAQVSPIGKDYAVVAVSQIIPAPSSLTDDQRKQFMQVMANARGQQEAEDFIEWLRNKGKIEKTDLSKVPSSE